MEHIVCMYDTVCVLKILVTELGRQNIALKTRKHLYLHNRKTRPLKLSSFASVVWIPILMAKLNYLQYRGTAKSISFGKQ